MSGKEQKAVAKFEEGYNCCQAVVAAFAPEWDMPVEAAMALSSSFGGGFAQMREVCGAVSGMFMAMGMSRGFTRPDQGEKKQALYAQLQSMVASFKEENGGMLCRELLALAPDPENHRPYCAGLVACAVRMTEEAQKLEELGV